MSLVFQKVCGECPPCGPECVANLPSVRTNIARAIIQTHGYPEFDLAGPSRAIFNLHPDWIQFQFRQATFQPPGTPQRNEPPRQAVTNHSLQYPRFAVGDVAEVGTWTEGNEYLPGGQYTCLTDLVTSADPSTDAVNWVPGGGGEVRHYWINHWYYGRQWSKLDAMVGDIVLNPSGKAMECLQAGSWRSQDTLPVFGSGLQNENEYPMRLSEQITLPGTPIYQSPTRLRKWSEEVSVQPAQSQVTGIQPGIFQFSFEVTPKRRRSVRSIGLVSPMSYEVPDSLPSGDPTKPYLFVRSRVDDFKYEALTNSLISPSQASGWTVLNARQLRYTTIMANVILADYANVDNQTSRLRGSLEITRTITVSDEIQQGDWGGIGMELLGAMSVEGFDAVNQGFVGQYDAAGGMQITPSTSASLQPTVQSQVNGGTVLDLEVQYTFRKEHNQKTITDWQHRWLDTPGFPSECNDYYPRRGYLKRRTTEQCLWRITGADGSQAIIAHEHDGAQSILLTPTLWNPQQIRHSQATIAPVGSYRCCPV